MALPQPRNTKPRTSQLCGLLLLLRPLLRLRRHCAVVEAIDQGPSASSSAWVASTHRFRIGANQLGYSRNGLMHMALAWYCMVRIKGQVLYCTAY